jgi:nitroreductase
METRTGIHVHELATKRFSPKAFTDRRVSPETLRTLFEAARWSPSSFNEQPWAFVAVSRENPKAFEKLVDVLVPKNAEWASTAPVLVLACARLTFSHNAKPNRHALYDLGQSVAWLTVEAAARDIQIHQMAGFDQEKAAAAVNLPQGWEAVTMFALGYVGATASAPRSRRSLANTVYDGRYGEPMF